MLQVQQITIIGTGLLGGSIGLALHARGFTGKIVGVDNNPQALQSALERNCIDSTAASIADAVASSQLAIIATPLGAFDSIFHELSRSGTPQLVTTDTGSSKTIVCSQARSLLPLPRAKRFVGSHPMAGSEEQGPTAARADLFQDKPCAITPAADTDPAATSMVEALWTTLGMRIVRLTPETHDRVVARISHLPHALAVLLVQLASRDGALELASSGYRDCTRIAGGDANLWHDIFTTNRQSVIDSLDAYAKEIAIFRKVLADRDDTALRKMLELARKQRDQWSQGLGADVDHEK